MIETRSGLAAALEIESDGGKGARATVRTRASAMRARC